MLNEIMLQDLYNLGLQKDDIILMHSSLSSLGYVEGGADTVIDTLLTVLNEGTLMIPALSYATVNAENPVFSVSGTPSCVGAISETFRVRAGVIRSLHPTHSVCGFGKYAEEILSQHRNSATPAGNKSPFALLPQYGGKILMLGCGLRPNTSMHAVEELVYPWYLMKREKISFRLIDENGVFTDKEYLCHNFNGVIQRYDRVAELMPVKCGMVLGAVCYLIDAAAMWKAAEKALRADEEHFIDRIS